MTRTSRATTPISRGSPVPGHKIRQVWTPEEDQLLSEAVARETPKHGPVSWHKIASHLPGRNNKDCRKRWHYSIANTIRKGTWMREEDEKLRQAVELYGARWSKIAEAVGTRNGDQCWKRWYDCLDPRIDKSPWTTEEDVKLLHLVSQHGRNWSDIVHKHFPNRTSLAAKNRYSILRRKQDGATSRSSSVRHAKSKAASSSTSTPSLSSSPYLSVPTTPSRTALSTPEPEFASEDWIALTDAEIDELLHQSSSQMDISGGLEGWYPSETLASATPSPQMGVDLEPDFGVPASGDWVVGGSETTAGHAWTHAQYPGFDSSLVDPQIQIHPASSATGYGGYYNYTQGHQQQQPAVTTQGYGQNNMLGVYQSQAHHTQVPYQGMYDASCPSGLVNENGITGMGVWQGRYSNTGSW